MDVYVDQLVGSGSAHDLFYTNAAVIAAYKNYVNAFVSRYANESTIMAWELCKLAYMFVEGPRLRDCSK